MTTTKLPTSMREACEMLYAQLTQEDIQQIRTRKIDATDMHFTLGLWVRNNWIYKGLDPETLGLKLCPPDPDYISNEILEALVKFIKKVR